MLCVESKNGTIFGTELVSLNITIKLQTSQALIILFRGIKEPHELDLGIDFIPEEEVALSYVFTGLDSENKDYKVKDKLDIAEVKRTLPPGLNFNFKSSIKSFQNTVQQAKCLIALTLIQSCKKPTGFYEQGCMELYNVQLSAKVHFVCILNI